MTDPPPVPIVECGAPEIGTGLRLTFIVVTKTVRPGLGVASIIALDGLAPIGHLRWDIEEGEIYFVIVDDAYRRKGVATALWTVADGVADSQGWAPLQHGSERSVEGDLWARSVGGDMPPLIMPARPFDELAAEGWRGAGIEPVE